MILENVNNNVGELVDTNEVIKVLPPKTAEEILAREIERKARTTLLMALPEDHLAKFHKMTDAKEMWDAIKSRFGGNDELKKMQKYILKQQFEGFSVSNSDGLHKGYDRFQSLLSQLEIHGAGVSTEDANRKFLRSLPSSWSQVSLVMRTKPEVDNLSFDDHYNNLRVFESDVKGSTGSSSSAQNVAFVSSESISSTNDVSTAYDVSTSSGYKSQRENSSSYTDELMYSFFANQSSGPQLDHEDLEQLDEFDLKEIDLKWQVVMISMRLKKFYKKTGRRLQFDAKEPVGFDKTKVECFNCHKIRHFAREYRSKGNQEIDWNSHAQRIEQETTLLGWLTQFKAQTLREQLGDASIEIQPYTQALKKVDAISCHLSEKSTLMSVKDKSGLGYGNQIHERVLSYENKVFQSVFDSRSSDEENSHVHDRFVNVEGMHAVPPLMTGNYMPPGPDREVDDSMFTYGPKQSKTSESDTQTSNFDSCESNSNVETLESVPEPVVVEPKVVSQPKVWSDAPIIEEYESDSDDDYVIQPSKEQEKPNFAFVNTVNFSHLIRDCDFHKKRMAKQVELNKKMVRVMVKGRLDIILLDQDLSSKQATIVLLGKVICQEPIVNEIRPRSIFYKSHSPIRRPFNRTTTPKANFSNQKVNTAEVKVVSAVRRKRETAVKPSADIKNWLVQSKQLLLASPKQTALGKGISNPLIVDSLLKTIWLSMHLVIAMKHWLFQSKRLLGRIVGFQRFLQLSAATYTSYYCQFYLVLLVKNTKDSRK
ncbi:hypothetical protein Tco_0464683 [Tanacetum coccineum]